MSGRIGVDDTGAARSIRRHVIFGSVCCVLLVGGLGAWAATAPLAGAVIAPGQIVVASNVKRIQHQEGGVVAALLVDNGVRVSAGEVVIRLDATVTRANLAIVESQLVDLAARRLRLDAERRGAAKLGLFDLTDSRLGGLSPLALERAGAAEAELFVSRRTALESRKGQLREQIVRIRGEIRGLSARLAASREQLHLVGDELVGVESLVDKGLVTIDRVSGLRRSKAELAGVVGDVEAQIAQAETRIGEIRIAITSLDHDRRSEAEAELRETDSKMAELAERAVAARDQLRRVDIRAPQAGTIHQLSVHTVGGVVAPGETVALVVPSERVLVVETRVRPIDVDHVATSQTAKLRLTGFDGRSTPELAGYVEMVSADVAVDQVTNEPYYAARLVINEGEQARLSQPLVPGMPVEAFITTSERTALDYLLKPLTDQFSKSMREP